jgi:glycine cleavage system regulatory protein
MENVRLASFSPQPQTRGKVCSFCHNLIGTNALFCDVCGTPQDVSQVFRVRSEMQRNIDMLTATLQSLEARRNALANEIKELENASEKAKLTQKIELESLDDKIKTLTSALQPLSVEVESLRTRKEALNQEVEALLSEKQKLEKETRSEALTIDSLHKERVEMQREVKRRPVKNARRQQAPTKPKENRTAMAITHTFVCSYHGNADWNTELSKLLAQLELSLDQAKYSYSPEKIVLSVTGSRANIEKLAASLNRLEGFTNLRTKLAATKNSLRESIRARDIHKEQLNELSRVPWYKENRSLSKQRVELSQRLAEEDFRIRAMTEDLKALENLVGSDAAKN